MLSVNEDDCKLGDTTNLTFNTEDDDKRARINDGDVRDAVDERCNGQHSSYNCAGSKRRVMLVRIGYQVERRQRNHVRSKEVRK